MIRSVLALMLIATPLAAQETAAPAEPAAEEQPVAPAFPAVMIRADDIEDADVYALADSYDQGFWDSGDPFGPVSADWGEIGEVEDLVIDDTGSVVGVTVEVGGFLGIGEKTVLIPLEDLRLVQRPGSEGFFIVTRMTNEDMDAAEDVSDSFIDAD
ncbi:hypothetical protein HKCCE2091_20285 [Rhodobacterales bacterium HKCCE2091]|nr:hypothetical protein [Rhodobacterales bacterium HKCCE2091]